jgi:hypothetical protein
MFDLPSLLVKVTLIDSLLLWLVEYQVHDKLMCLLNRIERPVVGVSKLHQSDLHTNHSLTLLFISGRTPDSALFY